MNNKIISLPLALVSIMGLSACDDTKLDKELSNIIEDQNLNDHPQRDLPSINDDIAQLGKKLFFTKALGGDFDSACVTCHHPVLGGGDDLSLSVGVSSNDEDLLGLGRIHMDGATESLPSVPRNAPTVFNLGLWDNSLFHDSRVESLNVVEGTNGASGDIRSPDSTFSTADNNAGRNLAAAQARFPVTSADEMRGFTFEAGNSNQDVRDHLAARIGNYGEGIADGIGANTWLTEFQTAFGGATAAEDLITYDRIAHALAEYERSMVFTDHPWQRYMDGDEDAISETAKKGAKLFFTTPENGGAGCVACHTGQLFTDEKHHTVAYPQIGIGKGDGTDGSDDFGRFRETGDADDKYAFRTASLLNIKVTGPYSHSGSMPTLESVVRHYVNQTKSTNDFVANQNGMGVCNLPQFEDMTNCATLYPNAEDNSRAALAKLKAEQTAGDSLVPENLALSDSEVDQLVAFLEALTDPCVEDRECLAPWIPTASQSVDNHQLNPEDAEGNAL
ncbi:hypothetical protein NBRC116188_17930 [Oceaniserpentilla sp. 4NH20-0058]|uniref:cytochrome-c peroxidase n=1 Tax=Oceaniserpentilla sp. 4NH20-0058 TaxID=3127660 RepID=UPI0031081BD3